MFDSTNPTLSRRTLLSGTVVGLLGSVAGCIEMGGSGATDAYITNYTDSTQTISLLIETTESGHTEIDTEVTIPSNEHRNPTAQDKITWGGTYTVSVSAEDGPMTTYTWEDPRDPLYIAFRADGFSFKTMKGTPESWNTTSN